MSSMTIVNSTLRLYNYTDMKILNIFSIIQLDLNCFDYHLRTILADSNLVPCSKCLQCYCHETIVY